MSTKGMFKCAKHNRSLTTDLICDECGYEIISDAIKTEREACAKLAEVHFIPGHSVAGPEFANRLATKIRDRKYVATWKDKYTNQQIQYAVNETLDRG